MINMQLFGSLYLSGEIPEIKRNPVYIINTRGENVLTRRMKGQDSGNTFPFRPSLLKEIYCLMSCRVILLYSLSKYFDWKR